MSWTLHASLRHIFKPMARGAAQEAPSPPSPPPPPTDAAGDVSTLSTADSSTVATFAVAGADGDTTASCSLEASSSAADDARDAELQQQKARVRTPRVLRRPKLTLEAVDAILAGEDPSTVLPPPPPRKPPLAKTPPAPVPTRKPPVKKRRGRDVPGVEWDESLFHFANCMRIELGELNAEFVANVRVFVLMAIAMTGGRVLTSIVYYDTVVSNRTTSRSRPSSSSGSCDA